MVKEKYYCSVCGYEAKRCDSCGITLVGMADVICTERGHFCRDNCGDRFEISEDEILGYGEVRKE